MTATHDTIVAVSSPPGAAPRGLVRLSGPRVNAILNQLIAANDADSNNSNAGPRSPAPRRLHAARFRLHAAELPILFARFTQPHSYTGQDLAELQCPGQPALLERILHRILACGARLAEPGEFTFRAFVAGKLDLTEAEGVAATIAATSDSQLAAAAQLRRGELGRFAAELVDQLATQLALVEAGIDFVDQEDVVPIGPAALDDQLTALQMRLTDLLQHSRAWGALEALPRVVLVGLPSAGKSTLFNALLGRRRAVTSPWPGTTRDVLSEPLTLTAPSGRRIEVMLTDIAGLDEPTAALDRDVQAAVYSAIDRADLILLIDDGSPHRAPFHPPAAAPQLHVRTKTDLVTTGAHETPHSPHPSDPLHVSAHTGRGLDALRRAIAARLADTGVILAGDMLALQPRHESALRQADEALTTARRLLHPQRDQHVIAHVELVAAALRTALDELACLGGQMTPDDVIARIFATFCVGK